MIWGEYAPPAPKRHPTDRRTPGHKLFPGHGPGKCRVCAGDLPGRRTSFCSEACVDDYFVRTGSTATIRALVLARDRGVCALCGLDTKALAAMGSAVRGRWGRTETSEHGRWNYGRTVFHPFTVFHDTGLDAWRAGLPPGFGHVDPHQALWQADHIVPVAEGGGGCGLDGYRTLCLPCHHRVTGELRRRLNQRAALAVVQTKLEAWLG